MITSATSGVFFSKPTGLSFSTNLTKPNPQHLSNKGYRDLIISTNILQKSIQLYNDITSADANNKAAFARADNFLNQLRENTTEKALSLYSEQNKSSLLGTRFDIKN